MFLFLLVAFLLSLSVLVFFVKYKAHRGTKYWKNFEKGLVGHRGCRLPNNQPPAENTLRAFAYALDNGAEMFEIDIRFSADRQIIVFHDNFLHRLMVLQDHHQQQKITAMTLSEIKKLKFRGEDSSVTVPTLDETLQLLHSYNRNVSDPQKKKKLLIEVKDWFTPKEMSEALVELYQKQNLYDSCYVISFNPMVLWQLKRKDPEIVTCLLYRKDLIRLWSQTKDDVRLQVPSWSIDLLDRLLVAFCESVFVWKFLGIDMIGPEQSIYSKDLQEKCKSHSRGIYLWVVNDQKRLEDLLALDLCVSTDVLFPLLKK